MVSKLSLFFAVFVFIALNPNQVFADWQPFIASSESIDIKHAGNYNYVSYGTKVQTSEKHVPPWIKSNAGWWADGQIDDETFINGIKFLIEKKIIIIKSMPEQITHTEQNIPAWVKNNAGWWAADKISEKEFLNAITHLIKTGIISIKSDMNVSSDAFEDHGIIPSEYTCDGINTSPKLIISNVPQEADSLALIMDDPDAPSGVFVHWIAWNIPPDTKTIKKGQVLENQGLTSFDKIGYGGPCPPSGTHRYFFKIFALDTLLELEPNARKSDLEKAMSGHVLDKAYLVGKYSRE